MARGYELEQWTVDMSPRMNSADIEAGAATWFAKRARDDWNAEDQVQLELWLSSSTAHRVAFVRLTAAWERAGRLTALGAGVPRGTIPQRNAWAFGPLSTVPEATPEGVQSLAEAELRAETMVRGDDALRFVSRPRFSRRQGSIAALLVIAAAAATTWYLSTAHGKAYRTQIGALATVPLSDGSKVTLNTDSEIHVEVTPSERRVKLDRGEAFFEVAKDAARPFIVQIADKRVIAVGTQFSVRRDNNDIRVLVTDGRVQIERPGASSQSQTQLAAGSEARTTQAAVLVDQLAPARAEELLSWRTGYIIFRDTALADAVAEFNRYSARKIVIESPAIAGIRIGGNFRSDNADAFLWLLQSGFPIHVEQRSDRIILTKR
jgi:transmembrane sensor